VHSDEDWDAVPVREIERQQKMVSGADAAFAKPVICEPHGRTGVQYAILIGVVFEVKKEIRVHAQVMETKNHDEQA
jgi:hypothetical protein